MAASIVDVGSSICADERRLTGTQSVVVYGRSWPILRLHERPLRRSTPTRSNAPPPAAAARGHGARTDRSPARSRAPGDHLSPEWQSDNALSAALMCAGMSSGPSVVCLSHCIDGASEEGSSQRNNSCRSRRTFGSAHYCASCDRGARHVLFPLPAGNAGRLPSRRHDPHATATALHAPARDDRFLNRCRQCPEHAAQVAADRVPWSSRQHSNADRAFRLGARAASALIGVPSARRRTLNRRAAALRG